MTDRHIQIAQEPEADAILSRDDFALLIAMTLDQQYPMEHAFRGPRKIADRMGSFDIHAIADADTDEFIALCSVPPAIHRFPKSMATRVQDIARHIIDEYDGDTAAIWTRDNPSGKEVLKRLKALPGWGDQKARIFLALIGKQLGVAPYGWRSAAGAYGDKDSHRSIADVVDGESLLAVREFKKAEKAAAKSAAGKSAKS